jgi:hypothetical protein
MRRPITLMLLLPVFLAGRVQGQPTPTPTPYPGPELDIVFTGIVVFKEVPGTDPTYKVILPRSSQHYAYIRFPTSAYDESQTNLPLQHAFPCAGIQARYAVLVKDGLTLQPPGAIFDTKVVPGNALDSLVHLRDLVPPGTDFDPEYDKEKPGAKVAAQFDLRNGTLTPALEPGYDPYYWEFRETENAKPIKAVCSGSGITAKIRIKQGQGKNVYILSSQASQRLTLALRDGETTTINIGNSRNADIACPPGKSEPTVDPDFMNHYQVLKGIQGKYIPYPTTSCKVKPPGTVSLMSARGSNCIGSQWP